MKYENLYFSICNYFIVKKSSVLINLLSDQIVRSTVEIGFLNVLVFRIMPDNKG